jgi:hypothetical protein
MNNKKINEVLKFLKKNSLLKKKKSCFLVGTTKKKTSQNYYFTPYRESQKTVYSGAILYDNDTAIKLAKKIDGKVNYVFVDIEKKITNTKDILANIERATKSGIKKSIIKNYKPNDITVNSIENFIQDYYRKDRRGVGGKKILILGTGNIGTKIAIRLLESGGNIFLFRRDKKKLKKINEVLNIIKPRHTKSISNTIISNQLKFENYDVIIGCADNKIKFKTINKLVKKPLIIDVGKGVFSQLDLNQLNKKNIPIFRIDIENSLSSFIDASVDNESFFESSFINKKNKFRLVKKGILGNAGDIIVDDVIKPKRIVGVCGKDGFLKNISIKKYKSLKKEIIKKK